jgi:CHAT domain-containing protein
VEGLSFQKAKLRVPDMFIRRTQTCSCSSKGWRVSSIVTLVGIHGCREMAQTCTCLWSRPKWSMRHACRSTRLDSILEETDALAGAMLVRATHHVSAPFRRRTPLCLPLIHPLLELARLCSMSENRIAHGEYDLFNHLLFRGDRSAHALAKLKHALETSLRKERENVDHAGGTDLMLLGLIDDYQYRLMNASNPDDACADLASGLAWCLEKDDREEIFDAYRAVGADLLTLRPPGRPNRAFTCCNYAFILQKRADTTGDMALLDEVIVLWRETMTLYPTAHADRAVLCINLAALLGRRFDHTAQTTFLDEAIALEREAMKLLHPCHPHRAIVCNNLAASLKKQFQRVQQVDLLREAVALGREMMDLCPPGHPHRALSCEGLASSLRRLFDQTGGRILLDEAVVLLREVLDSHTENHPTRATSCENLADYLQHSFDQFSDLFMLDEAITLSREALHLQPPGHPSRSFACGNLAALLTKRVKCTVDVKLLDEVVILERESLNLQTPGSPGLAIASLNLALALQTQVAMGVMGSMNRAPFVEVSCLLQQALQIYPVLYSTRWLCFQGIASMALLLRDWSTAINSLRKMLSCPTYHDINSAVQSAAYLLDAIDTNAIACTEKPGLLGLYEMAIRLMASTAWRTSKPSTQLHDIRHGRALGSGAVTLSIMVNELSTGVRLIERARGIIWMNLINNRDPQVNNFFDQLIEWEMDVLKRLEASNDYNSREEHAETTIQEFMNMVKENTSLPVSTEVIFVPDVPTLLSTAHLNPVVILVAHKSVCHALVIPTADTPPTHIVLEITSEALSKLCFTGLTPQKRGSPTVSNKAERGIRISESASSAQTRLGKIWQTIVKPIIVHLGLSARTSTRETRPRIHWCTTGAFTYIPVHAAGMYDGPSQECCSDYFVSSYTPTLVALLHAQKNRHACTLTTGQIKLLGIAAEDAADPSLPLLKHATREAQEVVDIFSQKGASSSSFMNTPALPNVFAMLPLANMVHLACHGVQNLEEPHESRFCLSAGSLTVNELMKMDLENAFFAFLSACETAKGAEEHADEVVHLAAAMLFAGFKSVVATMW